MYSLESETSRVAGLKLRRVFQFVIWRQNSLFRRPLVFALNALNWLDEAHHGLNVSHLLRKKPSQQYVDWHLAKPPGWRDPQDSPPHLWGATSAAGWGGSQAPTRHTSVLLMTARAPGSHETAASSSLTLDKWNTLQILCGKLEFLF